MNFTAPSDFCLCVPADCRRNERATYSGYDDVSKDVSNNIVTSPIVESERTTSTDKMKNKNNEQPSLQYKLETKILTV